MAWLIADNYNQWCSIMQHCSVIKATDWHQWPVDKNFRQGRHALLQYTYILALYLQNSVQMEYDAYRRPDKSGLLAAD
jgi:hypothetical protein